ncbi:MAG: hypothetical protein PSN34_11245 [Urechidicola sp.]|nr:hypothetical protein [Urechidicola sp.]
MKKLTLSFIVIILISSLTSYSQENDTEKNSVTESKEQHPILSKRFIANAGLFIPTKTLEVRIDGASENEIINFTEAFDFNRSESTFAANFMWRFSRNKKWSLSVEYFGVKSNHNVMLEDEIEWEDATYPVGVSVDAGFRINMYRIFFGRSIVQKQNHELGGGLGVHAMDIRTFIEGSAFLGDAVTPTLERKSVSVVAPVPNIGFWYYYTPNDKWALTARVDWFAITIDKYGGSLWNLAPGVKYQVFKNVGVGLNYRYIKTSIDVDETNWHGDVDLIFQGPLFTLSGNF